MGNGEYWILQNQDPNGLYWQACWKQDANLITFSQAEVDVTNCLVDLHFQVRDLLAAPAVLRTDCFDSKTTTASQSQAPIAKIHTPVTFKTCTFLLFLFPPHPLTRLLSRRYIGSLTTNGYSSIAQLTGDQSDAIQGAVSAINGAQVNGGDTVGPVFYLTDSTGVHTDGSYQGWQVNWQGEQTCDDGIA